MSLQHSGFWLNSSIDLVTWYTESGSSIEPTPVFALTDNDYSKQRPETAKMLNDGQLNKARIKSSIVPLEGSGKHLETAAVVMSRGQVSPLLQVE